jgi:hypothetical protein
MTTNTIEVRLSKVDKVFRVGVRSGSSPRDSGCGEKGGKGWEGVETGRIRENRGQSE